MNELTAILESIPVDPLTGALAVPIYQTSTPTPALEEKSKPPAASPMRAVLPAQGLRSAGLPSPSAPRRALSLAGSFSSLIRASSYSGKVCIGVLAFICTTL